MHGLVLAPGRQSQLTSSARAAGAAARAAANTMRRFNRSILWLETLDTPEAGASAVDKADMAAPAPAQGQISGSMSSVLLRRVRAERGDAAVQEILERSGVPYSAQHLDDPANWIWHREAIALFEAAVAVTGDDALPQRIGEDALRQHAGPPVATLLRGLGSPQAVYEQLAVGVTKFSTVTELDPSEVTPGRAVVRARTREGFEHHSHLCAWRIGLLSTPPMLFGLPPAVVTHPECALRGDRDCVYEMRWDADDAAATGDPQQIITALEAQLTAMKERLDSMYATARDLI